MQGTVIILREDPKSGPELGVQIGSLTVPITPRDGAVRLLRPDEEITFITNRNGTAEITTPAPRIGCERQR